MLIRYKKLRASASAPTQSTTGAAAFDLTADRIERDTKARTCKVFSGVAVEIPRGYVGLLFPRSSICKTTCRLTNSVGVIDSDYRGEVTAVFDDALKPAGSYQIGDRFAQLMIVALPYVQWEEADELTPTERGTGGYGSTRR